jgi:hypothetical protein
VIYVIAVCFLLTGAAIVVYRSYDRDVPTPARGAHLSDDAYRAVMRWSTVAIFVGLVVTVAASTWLLIPE